MKPGEKEGFVDRLLNRSAFCMQDYRKLRVWRKGHIHVRKVRRAANRFPNTGYASLKSQMTRSAESIVFNIVEGYGSMTPREFARFLAISIKSSSELHYQLTLARDYGCLPQADWTLLEKRTRTIRKMLCGLRKKVLDSDP